MPIRKNQPQYAIIADTLINDIAQQKYPVGTLLPPELDMAEQFNVSRNTMRSALRMLVDMGLVSRRAGRGTLVQARRIEPNYVQVIESPDDLIPDISGTEQSVVSSREVTADDELAMLLAASPGTQWLEFSTLRRRRTTPVSYTRVYVPPALRGIRARLNKLRRPSYKAVETALRRKITEVVQQSDAVGLPGDVAQALKREEGSPALRTVRRYIDEDGRVAMVTDTYSPSGREHHTVHFRMNWPTPAED